jgi:hypothetical protein
MKQDTNDPMRELAERFAEDLKRQIAYREEVHEKLLSAIQEATYWRLLAGGYQQERDAARTEVRELERKLKAWLPAYVAAGRN